MTKNKTNKMRVKIEYVGVRKWEWSEICDKEEKEKMAGIQIEVVHVAVVSEMSKALII